MQKFGSFKSIACFVFTYIEVPGVLGDIDLHHHDVWSGSGAGRIWPVVTWVDCLLMGRLTSHRYFPLKHDVFEPQFCSNSEPRCSTRSANVHCWPGTQTTRATPLLLSTAPLLCGVPLLPSLPSPRLPALPGRGARGQCRDIDRRGWPLKTGAHTLAGSTSGHRSAMCGIWQLRPLGGEGQGQPGRTERNTEPEGEWRGAVAMVWSVSLQVDKNLGCAHEDVISRADCVVRELWTWEENSERIENVFDCYLHTQHTQRELNSPAYTFELGVTHLVIKHASVSLSLVWQHGVMSSIVGCLWPPWPQRQGIGLMELAPPGRTKRYECRALTAEAPRNARHVTAWADDGNAYLSWMLAKCKRPLLGL